MSCFYSLSEILTIVQFSDNLNICQMLWLIFIWNMMFLKYSILLTWDQEGKLILTRILSFSYHLTTKFDELYHLNYFIYKVYESEQDRSNIFVKSVSHCETTINSVYSSSNTKNYILDSKCNDSLDFLEIIFSIGFYQKINNNYRRK